MSLEAERDALMHKERRHYLIQQGFTVAIIVLCWVMAVCEVLWARQSWWWALFAVFMAAFGVLNTRNFRRARASQARLEKATWDLYASRIKLHERMLAYAVPPEIVDRIEQLIDVDDRAAALALMAEHVPPLEDL